MKKIISNRAVESYEVETTVGTYKVYALVVFKQQGIGKELVEMFIGVHDLSIPLRYFICDISKLETSAEKEEFACKIVNTYAVLLLPTLLKWGDCIESYAKDEVVKAMKLKELGDYTLDTALDILKASCPELKFKGGNVI